MLLINKLLKNLPVPDFDGVSSSSSWRLKVIVCPLAEGGLYACFDAKRRKIPQFFRICRLSV